MRASRDFRPSYTNTIMYKPNMRAPRDFKANYDNTIIYKPNDYKNKLLDLTRTIIDEMTLFQA